MSESYSHLQPAFWVGCFVFAVFGAACSGDRACSIDGDCFQGESCESGFCEVPSNSTPNNVATNQTPNNATNSSTNGQTTVNNAVNNTTGPTNNATTPVNNTAPACLVDLFANQCDEDEWEENDGYDPGSSAWDKTPWVSNSWCDGDALSEPKRTLSGTLCAGDRGDAFRLVVANNGPMCIMGDFVTFRILVEIKTPCDSALIRVEPYTFGRDPIRNDLCADDEKVRCTVTNGGLTHLIEWVWDWEQIFDPRVQIMSEAQNLQIDYDLTFEIVPQ